jgi:hypothetical protein
MLVPESYWLCSAFLCQENREGVREPKGSAFFVSIPVESSEANYVVTAAHNIQFARARSCPLYLRVNRKDGTAQDIEIGVDHWTESPNTDLAAVSFPGRVGDYRLTRVRPARFATDGVVREREIGLGDEVFFCGLFSEHAGRNRSQPVVRWGNISMMPGEKVRIGTPGNGVRSIDAYLVEARSWGGQSGSPAFVYFPPDRRLGFLNLPNYQGEPTAESDTPDHYAPLLLGLLQGHFDIRQDIFYKSEFRQDGAGESALQTVEATRPFVKINSGIAVVIPTQEIVDLLNEVTFREERVNLARRIASVRPTASMG